MLLLKTDLGVFSKEVLTVTAVLNVNYGFVKRLFAASNIGVVCSVVRTGSHGREEIWCSQPCACEITALRSTWFLCGFFLSLSMSMSMPMLMPMSLKFRQLRNDL